MDEIVIDSSCILDFLLNQNAKEFVQKTVGNSRLVAPDCLPYEIGDSISRLIKKELISIAEGVSVFHEFARIPIRFIEPDISNSIVIAGETGCNVYKAYYISLAKQFSLSLFTVNDDMKKAAALRGVTCL